MKKMMCAVLMLATFVFLLTGCGNSAPSASFDGSRQQMADQRAQQKAAEKAKEQTTDRKKDAEKSAKLTQKKIEEKATQAYDLVEQQTAEAQELGINGLTQKILYKGYLIYYKFCDFAISIIIVGWVIAILGNFLFHKLPKIRKFCILFFGVTVTGITFLIVFAPSMIQSLGK